MTLTSIFGSKILDSTLSGLKRSSGWTSWPTASMNPRSLTLALVGVLALSGCTPSEVEINSTGPDSETPLSVAEATGAISGTSELSQLPQQPPVRPKVLELGLFSSDELFAAGGGGCGMSLKPIADSTDQQGDILFHGLDDSPMLMKINGKMVEFALEEGRGPEFYGQTPSQTFSNAELDIIAVVDVEVGEQGESESVDISSGSVFLQGKSSNIQIPVEGDAGC